jgi:hypothetical protein
MLATVPASSTSLRAAGFEAPGAILKEGGVLLGLMGFQRHRDEPGIVLVDGARPVASDPDLVDVELTYALGRAYWKRGYATEAGAALISEGFDRLGIDRPHDAARFSDRAEQESRQPGEVGRSVRTRHSRTRASPGLIRRSSGRGMRAYIIRRSHPDSLPPAP